MNSEKNISRNNEGLIHLNLKKRRKNILEEEEKKKKRNGKIKSNIKRIKNTN